jgi:branched-chain amino acid transport system substrate-binding protein
MRKVENIRVRVRKWKEKVGDTGWSGGSQDSERIKISLPGGDTMKNTVGIAKNNQFLIICIIFVSAILFSIPAEVNSASKLPIKIGILYPFTGPYASLGQRMLRGWEVALEQVDYKVAGRPIELVVEDTKGDPNVCVTKVTRLIEKDHVHILGGVVSSAEAYAIRDTIDQSGTPLIITLANAGGLTREKRSPYLFRTHPAGGTGSHYMAQFLYEDLKLRKAVFLGADYSYGRENAEMFTKEFQRLGGNVLFEKFTPLGTADFGPYCAEILNFAGKADVLHFVYSGADAIRFVKTAADFGLNKKFIISNWGGTNDGLQVNSIGTAAEGGYHSNTYIFDIKTQANQRFLEQDKRKGGVLDAYDFSGYVGAEVVLRALEKIEGNVETKDEFLKALRNVKFEIPSGPFQFDPRSQNALLSILIGQTKKVDGEFGKFQNIRVKTITLAQDPWWLGR